MPGMSDRAVLLARVSKTGQDEDNQLPDLEKWSDSHGYTVVDTIRIHGKSAFTGKHKPDLDRAVRMVEAGQADVLVFWTLDRASRQGIDAALRFKFSVVDAGGRIEFTEYQELNGTGADAERAWADFADDARRESERRQRRVTAGLNRATGNGAALHHVKFGYAIVGSRRNKTWVVDEPKAAMVRGMYERSAAGESLGAVGRWATTQGFGNWQASRVRKLLLDTAYYGLVKTTVNGGRYEHDCPALVSLELWERANASARTARRYVRVPESPFAGVLRCGHCDTVLRRTSMSGNGSALRYWRCPKRCGNHAYEPLSAQVHDALKAITAELTEERIVRDEDMRAVRLKNLEAELSGIGRAGLSPGDMVARIQQIDAEMTAIKAEAAPRGRLEYKGLGVGVGEAYSALDHLDHVTVNAWLKGHHLNVWVGETDVQLLWLRRMGITDPFVSGDLLVTWHLTDEDLES
jgi:DNA invertase Pin-like site-specific DNA recombinase